MKKICSIISALLIALSLTACNNGTENSPDTQTSSGLTSKAVSDIISESDIGTVKKTYGTVYDTKIIDLDLDGKNELLVLAGKANTKEIDVWKKTDNEMLFESSFGAGKVNFIDKLELKSSEINGENVYLFSFSYDEGGTMKADEVLSMIRKASGGYEVEYLLSRGTLTYSDISKPVTKEFYRKGWSKYDIAMDADFNDISKEEYDRLYAEYTAS